MGSRVWPEQSIVILTVVPDEETEELMHALRACRATLYPGESMHAFAMPVESML